MAVVPPPRASTRGKAAARPRIKEYPNSLVGLISWIVDEDRRTRNCMLLVVLIFFGCCALIDTWLAATKGVHALSWRLLLPGGLCGGGDSDLRGHRTEAAGRASPCCRCGRPADNR